MPDHSSYECSNGPGRAVSGTSWWVVLVAAAVGAAAAIGGSMWTSHVQRRISSRAEWFRRLQWAWELTRIDDVHSVAAGTAMMNYLAATTDERDAVIIDRIAPIARTVSQLVASFPSESTDVDVSIDDSHTGADGETGSGDPRG